MITLGALKPGALFGAAFLGVLKVKRPVSVKQGDLACAIVAVWHSNTMLKSNL